MLAKVKVNVEEVIEEGNDKYQFHPWDQLEEWTPLILCVCNITSHFS